MNKPYVTTFLAALAQWATACNVVEVDDEPRPEPGQDTGDPADDHQECLDAVQVLPELDCRPGYTPQLHYVDGGSTAIDVDDPAVAAGLSVGLLFGFGAGAKADWVGYDITQNSVCVVGCFIGCQPGQTGCVGDPDVTVGCLWCGDGIEQQACTEFVSACQPGDPEDDGGLDETGGGETTGGVMEAPYDCGQWHPEAIRQPVAGGAFHIPQAIVDELVLGVAEPLAECDGLRLRQASDGHWGISRMNNPGLLGALGLRVGDELRMLDDIELDSLGALASVLARFIAEDGTPRQLGVGHPGFTLRVRRGERDFVRQLRVVPSSDVPR